jgi:hypothetical protein
MAILNLIDSMTSLEVARRSSNPDAFTIIETMSMENTMLLELPAIEANDGAVHTGLQRKSYPGGQHRIYDRGVKTTASQTKPFHDWITMLECFSRVDAAKARHSGNPAALYNSEASAFIMGMGVDQADDCIYGNRAVDPAEINGLATRLAVLSDHCVDAGLSGTGSNLTSIYLVAAGPKACHLIYPRGSTSVGVFRQDLNIYEVDDGTGSGATYLAHTDHFIAEYGLSVEHPDAVIRICNIPATLTADQRKALVETVLRQQMNLTKGIVNTILFCNKNIAYQFQRAARELQYVVYPEKDPWGNPVMVVNGLRMRRMDVILDTEDQVTA